MDQGLKERLVGAAVLVAIGVWLIPWVLDGPEAPVETNANSLQLPAAEEPMPMRTQTLRLGGDAAPAAEQPMAAAPPQPEPTATASAPAPTEVPETATDTSDEVPAAATPASAAAATPPPSETPSRAANAETRTAAAPAPKPAATPSADGKWVVQLGVFGEEANARRIAQRSATFGYKADVSSYRANGRTLYRVRVGSATSRGQADATASALRAHGLTEARVLAAEP
jgi:DedD protein